MNASTNGGSLGESQEYEAVVAFYSETRKFNYADLAAFVLIVFEFVITFDREVHFVWGRKMTWARSVLLVNRYLSILEYFVVLGPLLPADTYLVLAQLSICVLVADLTEGFQIVLYAVWAAFSGLRVFAISSHNILVTVVVVSLALVPVVTNSYVTSLTFSMLTDAGCMSSMSLSDVVWIRYALSVATRSCLIASDALVILVTWIKTWGTIRLARKLHVEMSFTSLILREGVLYFSTLLSLNIIQIIFDLVEVGDYGLIIPFVNAMTPILISRFLFDLDNISSSDTEFTPSLFLGGDLQAGTLQFADPESTTESNDIEYEGVVFNSCHSVYRVGDLEDVETGKELRLTQTW